MGGGETSQAVVLLGLLKEEGIYFESEVPFDSEDAHRRLELLAFSLLMLPLAKGVCSQESTASSDHVVLFVD